MGLFLFVALFYLLWGLCTGFALRKSYSLSHVQLLANPWTVARQAPLSIGFSKLEYWSGLPFPSSGHLPDPGIEPGSAALQADSLPSEPPGKPSLSPSFALQVRAMM